MLPSIRRCCKSNRLGQVDAVGGTVGTVLSYLAYERIQSARIRAVPFVVFVLYLTEAGQRARTVGVADCWSPEVEVG